jgi:hypothetical protein
MAKGLRGLCLRVLLLTLCEVQEADALVLPAPATNARTPMESDDKFSSDEFGSIGSGDTNTQIQHQVLLSLEIQRHDAA